MRRVLLVFICAMILMFSTAAHAGNNDNKIVVFKAGLSQEVKQKAVNDAGGKSFENLDLVNGAVVSLPAAAEKKLVKSSQVEGIYPDSVVYAAGFFTADANKGVKQNQKGKDNKGKQKGEDNQGQQQGEDTQQIPWGIERIGSDKAWPTSTGAGIKVAVLDSGVNRNHPDLAGNINGGFNAINKNKSFEDGFGHGTHISGTIAALNNTYGVVGVGHNISIYAVKVLDDSGTGKVSDVIKGLDWAVKNGMQVCNLSLSTTQDTPPFRKAIAKANAAGIVLVAATGNSGTYDAPFNGPTTYPAAYPEVIAVSAIDEFDQLAPFSNIGKVELTSPGVNIYSTIPPGVIPGMPADELYTWGTGTSMACPHVVGTVGLLLATTPPAKYDKNKNKKWDPDEVKQRLYDTAEPLRGLTAEQQGAGLVRADLALKRK